MIQDVLGFWQTDEPAFHSIPTNWPFGLEVIQNLQINPVKRKINHNSLLRTNQMVNVVTPAASSPIHQFMTLQCSALQWHCSVPKTRGGTIQVWVQSAQHHGPSGWGQVLARARTCPPALDVDIPISPCGGAPFPESHSQYCSDYPAIILSLGYYLLFLFVSACILALDFQKTSH